MEVHKRELDLEKIIENIIPKDRKFTRQLAQDLDFTNDSVCDGFIVADGQEWRVAKMLGEPYEEPEPRERKEEVIFSRTESNPGKRRRRNLKRKRRGR